MSYSEAEFKTLVEEADAIILLIRNKTIFYANPMLEIITGYQKENFLTHSNLCLHRQVMDCDLNAPSKHQQTKFLTKQGKECYLSYSIKTIKLEGRLVQLVTAIDITKYKQAENESQKILKQEEEIKENRLEFLSMIVHELRTPLTTISFSSNLLKRYDNCWNREKRQQYFHRLQKAVDMTNLLIDKVLILSRTDTGELSFEPQTLNIIHFCNDLLYELYPDESRRKYIKFSYQGDYPLVCADKRMLQVIFTNLLENAIKYSPANPLIDFVLSCQSGQVIFQIKDRGIGIEPIDMKRLFEPFYRGNNIGEYPGSGLGLCIVKKLVDIHGGQIALKSQLGVGTEFTITLPSKIKYQHYESKIKNLSYAE